MIGETATIVQANKCCVSMLMRAIAEQTEAGMAVARTRTSLYASQPAIDTRKHLETMLANLVFKSSRWDNEGFGHCGKQRHYPVVTT